MDGPLVNCQLMSYEPRIRVFQVHIAHPLESQHQHVDGGAGNKMSMQVALSWTLDTFSKHF